MASEDAGGPHPGNASLETDQRVDSFTRRSLGSLTTVRLLYQRCQEARAQGLPGQDHARLVSARHGASLSFCVADGVGSSYQGDFAARYLSRHLVAWLSQLDALPGDETAAHERLAEALSGWAAAGQAELRGMALPAGATELVNEVLAELREGYGSEAVFFAGRIEHAGEAELAAGAPRARALLCWMGNVSAEIVTAEPHAVALGQSGDDRDRWSTARGLRGRLAVRTPALDGLRRLIIYTDGLGGIGPQIARLDDDGLRTEASRLLTLPASDDVTVLDCSWAPATTPPQTGTGEQLHG